MVTIVNRSDAPTEVEAWWFGVRWDRTLEPGEEMGLYPREPGYYVSINGECEIEDVGNGVHA